MSLRNTDTDYGTLAKWLHWGTAILFLGSYLTVYYRQWFTEKRTPENWIAIQLHLSIGITIAVVVALRIIWRLSNRPPEMEPGSKLEHFAARAGHWALYTIMVIVPTTGYLGSGANTEFFFIFEIPNFESTWLFDSLVRDGMGLDFKTFERPMDFLHKRILGPWLVWILILGHASAALYHHIVKKDRTLLKMTTGN